MKYIYCCLSLHILSFNVITPQVIYLLYIYEDNNNNNMCSIVCTAFTKLLAVVVIFRDKIILPENE